MDESNVGTTDSVWKPLYRVGGAAADLPGRRPGTSDAPVLGTVGLLQSGPLPDVGVPGAAARGVYSTVRFGANHLSCCILRTLMARERRRAFSHGPRGPLAGSRRQCAQPVSSSLLSHIAAGVCRNLCLALANGFDHHTPVAAKRAADVEHRRTSSAGVEGSLLEHDKPGALYVGCTGCCTIRLVLE
jgi:hypothetical protein